MSDELKSIEERIAKARAARMALEEASERRREAARAERLLRIEEQRLADEPRIEEARTAHGEDAVAVIDTDLGAIVVKKPNHLKWNALVAKGEKLNHVDMVGLVKSCVVYPDWPHVDRVLEEAPAAMNVLVGAIAGLATKAAQERAGK